MDTILLDIRRKLSEQADETTQISSQRFFKPNEVIKSYGLKSTAVSKISQSGWMDVRKKGLSKTQIFQLCDSLWQSGYQEEGGIACNWAYALHKEYTLDDLITFEFWLKTYVTNWAFCDTLCNHTIAAFMEQFPDKITELKRWATMESRWMKRGAAVTLIIPARKGLFLEDIFAIADLLLMDPDDLVQKGYGWMLKAASEAHQDKVFDYVIANKATMPRTALRYAIEKMPKELRTQAMAKA